MRYGARRVCRPAHWSACDRPEAARELIDMLDALYEKTKGNLAPEEDNWLLDLLGKLKMTYLEINSGGCGRSAKAKAKARLKYHLAPRRDCFHSFQTCLPALLKVTVLGSGHVHGCSHARLAPAACASRRSAR